MQRIDTSTAAKDLFGPGKPGFTDGDPGLVPETELDADWFNTTQEEIANAVELSGQTLDSDDNTQLHQAIRKPVEEHIAQYHGSSTELRARRSWFALNF